MDWKHGYFADGGYTFGYYPETMPSRLRWATLIQGHITPALKFRYLDAGCGQGLNLILAAAAHPESEFIGIDFLPEHIAHARALAVACKVKNVTFFERDFLELASKGPALGEFDYIVCHGITTWIAPEVRKALFSFIDQTLKPGGVFYNSYNTFPGWLGTVPFQHLTLIEQRQNSGLRALEAAKKHINTLKEVAPSMINALPALESRLKMLDQQDSSYLVQEYNNRYWKPVFVSEMIDELASFKLSYLGTTTLPEVYNNLLPSAVQDLLNGQESLLLREQIRDYACNQSFRRDLYVKGRMNAWPGELIELVGDFRVAVNKNKPLPEDGSDYVMRSGTGETYGDRKFYDSIIDLAGNSERGLTVGDIVRSKPEPYEKHGAIQAVSMLLYGGWLMPTTHSDLQYDSSGVSANSHIAKAVCRGAPYRHVCVPKLGGALPMSDTEWMMLDCYFRDIPPSNWPHEVKQCLAKLSRRLLHNGQPVEDAESIDGLLEQNSSEFLANNLPFLKMYSAA